MSQSLIVPIGEKVKLADFDPNYKGEYKRKRDVQGKLRKTINKIIELQELLYSDSNNSLLIVLQAMDAGGKDGTIKHVMGAVNPQGCDVKNFKAPSVEEAAHDFLWRYHFAAPKKGKIVIFNRSYYEDVLVVRVHNLVPKSVWSKRYNQINNFEKMLVENGTTILKFYLHISKDEQKKRFEDRLNRTDKHWKFSDADLRERQYWDQYMEAFEVVLSKCNTKVAPWHIVPANHKWYRDLVIGKAIVKALEGLDMKYPEPERDFSDIEIKD